MHNLTPHNHDSKKIDVVFSSESADADLLSILSSCFHRDLGEGHLEHLVVAKNVLPEFLLNDLNIQDSDLFSQSKLNEDPGILKLIIDKNLIIPPFQGKSEKVNHSLRAPPC